MNTLIVKISVESNEYSNELELKTDASDLESYEIASLAKSMLNEAAKTVGTRFENEPAKKYNAEQIKKLRKLRKRLLNDKE